MVIASAVEAPARTQDVCLNPPALAMVWMGPGRPHEALAVPGVRLLDGDVLMEVELATACGSDLHTVQGRRDARTPLVLGHEYVGRVTALAGHPRALDGSPLHVGDRVVWAIMASCGSCDRCLRGIPQKCRHLVKYGHERIEAGWELTGGFATHVHVRAGTAIARVGEQLAAEVLAPAACGTATAWAAVDRADRIVDVDASVVLVTGAGLIGLTASAIAADRGARVVVSDPSASRRELALRFGAEAAVDPGDPDALTRALQELGVSEVDVVIEASGEESAVRSATRVVGVGGVVVLVGSVFPSAEVGLDAERVVRGLMTIRGVHNYAPHDLAAAVAYLRQRATSHPFAELVGATFALEDLDRALESAAAPGAPVRIGISSS